MRTRTVLIFGVRQADEHLLLMARLSQIYAETFHEYCAVKWTPFCVLVEIKSVRTYGLLLCYCI